MYAAQDEGSDVLDEIVLYAMIPPSCPEKLRWVHAAFQENAEAAIHVSPTPMMTYPSPALVTVEDGWIIELDEEDLAEKYFP